MLSPPQNMKPYLGHCGSIMRAYSLLRVLLCFLSGPVHEVPGALAEHGNHRTTVRRHVQLLAQEGDQDERARLVLFLG